MRKKTEVFYLVIVVENRVDRISNLITYVVLRLRETINIISASCTLFTIDSSSYSTKEEGQNQCCNELSVRDVQDVIFCRLLSTI